MEKVQKVISPDCNMRLSELFRIDQLPLNTLFEPVCVACFIVLGQVTKQLGKANISFVVLVCLPT